MDNEEQNLSPDAVTSETDDKTSQNQENNQAKTNEVKKRSIFVVGLGVLCLVFVFLFVYLAWMAPGDEVVEMPVEQAVQDDDTEEVEEAEDETYVLGRIPEVLGLRIDTAMGRFFVLPETGQTLYVTEGECLGECLNEWTPYEAESALSQYGNLGTVERSDGSLQYTWGGKALYTFNLDDDRSVYGDGYEGNWFIARP